LLKQAAHTPPILDTGSKQIGQSAGNKKSNISPNNFIFILLYHRLAAHTPLADFCLPFRDPKAIRLLAGKESARLINMPGLGEPRTTGSQVKNYP